MLRLAQSLSVTIRRCLSHEQPGWVDLREALWPHCAREVHLTEMSYLIAEPERYVQFIAYEKRRLPVGLVEASLRSDHVNGTASSPVAFLEGIYVDPAYRRKGVASHLVKVVAEWAVASGCKELASDAALNNELGHIMHKALGFQETERVVFFRKALR
jgi:aminoglycoside 6'-N-acetyltransferase I